MSRWAIFLPVLLLAGCAGFPFTTGVTLYKSVPKPTNSNSMSVASPEIVLIKYAPVTNTYYVGHPTPTPRPLLPLTKK